MRLDVQGAAAGRARFRGRVSLTLATIVTSLLLPAFAAYAQSQPTSSPEDEYKKLIKVSEDIQPLGETPFGERIGLYDGSLSFEQTDISFPGQGPTITVGRVFNLHTADERRDLQYRAFGDWDIDIPLITTITPVKSGIRVGWLVSATNKKAICSSFTLPPSVAGIGGDSSRADWEPDSWWQGYQMRIPGQGSQELLRRSTGNTAAPGNNAAAYPIVTKQDWSLGCLAQTVNDPTTEGFLAISPDGTKYYFNRLSYRSMPGLSRPTGSGPSSLMARTDGMMSPMAAQDDILNREEGRMLVTRIEDRFGNGINYTYDGNHHLTSIDGDDQRHVTISYGSDGNRISSITMQGGAAGTRTWQYGYTQVGLLNQLTSVTQPDGSRWTYDLASFNTAYVDMSLSAGNCDAIGVPANLGTSYTSSMTHPSGLSGSFTVTPVKRGRSYVPRECKAGPNMPATPNGVGTHAALPNASYSMAIIQKQISGAGIGTQTWQYAYSPSNESWSVNCSAGCAASVWTRVQYPDGHAERSNFSNRYDFSESLLLSEEIFDGAADTTRRRKFVQYAYVNPDPAVDGRASAYPSPWGSTRARLNTAQMQNKFPMGAQVVQINDDPSPGDTYTWNAVSFDAFARPADVQRYNSIGYSARESTAFKDDYAHWVLGLPLQTTNVVTGEEISRNVYDPNSLTLAERYRFGRKVMGYAFNAQGQLASFTDGNNHTTTLGSYKRGIPQAIGYPDGTSQSLVVDDLSQITSITNQVQATTSYTYDAIGRLASISYPAGMNPKVFGYGYVTGAERGVAANHWRRSITQGGKVQMTYFDAMLRPILSDTYRNDSAFYTSIRSGYDWKGRKIFQSYPYSGAPDITAMSGGVMTSYDVIGRATASTQTSELGNLTATTQYLAGGAKTATDPKNNATTSWFQAFDQPSYDTVVKVQAPEGVVQTIQRDVYGNPLSITQGGAGQSVTKTMTYDTWHRLCRTWEPESGSEIMAYDGADNLAWSVSGASFNTAGACGQDQVAEASKTVRAYDAMNRVTSVLYPTGTAPSTFTYDALGNPATATSGNVGWTFGHNTLGQLTAEVLAVDGWVWGLGYGYDGNGALSTVRYPDEEIVAYNPDALGRPTTVGGYASGISYFPDGDVASYNIGNGGIYSADKNARNLLHNFTYGKGGVPIVSEDFTYDGNGNVSAIGDVSGSNQRTKSMSYDGLNRLLSATASNLWGTESYTYDTLNNIRTLSNSGGTSTYSYDGANLLASISNGAAPVHTFQYDGRGNTVGKDGQVLNFDLANRLTSIPGKGQYTYDAAGRRVKKVTPSGTTYYAYNSAGQLMWEADPVTRLGSNYVYLGKKLIAKSTENFDILRQSQVKAAIAIVGIPKLAVDGSTIDVTLDIANNGTRPLSANSQYPVQMGYHLIDVATGASTQPEAGVNLPADIPVGAHGTITMHVAAAAVLGMGKKIRFSLLQAGVAWFQDWPGNNTVEAGPYSTCPTAGTGNLCNNVTGLTPEQVNVTLTITSAPTLSPDGQSVLATVDIANNGRVTLASTGPHPVDLGNHVIDAAGNVLQTDITRAIIPEIAPGQHAAVGISTPASVLLGTGRLLQFEMAQEGINWFRAFGMVPIATGPYVTLGGATSSTNGSFALSWQPIAGATSYNLQERLSNGSWTTVQGSTATSWSASGRGTGAYSYQVQACAASGCAPYGPAWAVNVLLPPPVPASISASAPTAGPITVSWAGSATATRYVVNQQFNGGAWTTYYNAAGTSTGVSPPASGTYVYQVQACNSSGCSGFQQSNAVAITLPPASAPAIAGGGANHSGAYAISWDGVAGAATYNVVESANGGGWTQLQNTAAGTWSTSGRVNGTYVYQVQACNAGGCGPWSAQAVVTVSLPPPTPGWPRISQTSTSSKPVVTVSWSSVLYATHYELVMVYPSGYTESLQDSADTSWRSLIKFTGSLQFKFRACNDVGCSAWSPAASINLVSGD